MRARVVVPRAGVLRDRVNIHTAKRGGLRSEGSRERRSRPSDVRPEWEVCLVPSDVRAFLPASHSRPPYAWVDTIRAIDHTSGPWAVMVAVGSPKRRFMKCEHVTPRPCSTSWGAGSNGLTCHRPPKTPSLRDPVGFSGAVPENLDLSAFFYVDGERGHRAMSFDVP